MLTFPYGKAAFSFVIIALVSGLFVTLRRVETRKTTLTMWTFADTHYAAYLKAIPAFEAAHPGVTVKVEYVNGQAVTSRLQAAFHANLEVPDVVEVEISSAGGFFRGPLEHVGFLDLTDRVKKSGLWDKMVQSRFSAYTTHGRIFGLPHDVHPVMLACRRDLLEKEGVDINKIETWDDFIKVGRKITIPGKRYLLELSDSGTDNIEVMLFQRGGGYFDPEGRCIFDNEIGVQTMLFYTPLVAGKNKIGSTLGANQILTQAVEQGYMLCLFAPDWRTKGLEKDIPRMSGNMALMPLPALKPGGLRTSTWGGTMLGIAKKTQHPDLAWELAQHLYLDKPELAQRFQDTNIIPCLKEAWNQPAFEAKRPYWSGQPLGALYANLAPQVPPQYSSPYVGTAKAKFGEALVSCVQYYNANGEAGFEEFARKRLKQSADEVRNLSARNPFQ